MEGPVSCEKGVNQANAQVADKKKELKSQPGFSYVKNCSKGDFSMETANGKVTIAPGEYKLVKPAKAASAGKVFWYASGTGLVPK